MDWGAEIISEDCFFLWVNQQFIYKKELTMENYKFKKRITGEAISILFYLFAEHHRSTCIFKVLILTIKHQ